jgi:hypothetical protein
VGTGFATEPSNCCNRVTENDQKRKKDDDLQVTERCTLWKDPPAAEAYVEEASPGVEGGWGEGRLMEAPAGTQTAYDLRTGRKNKVQLVR